MQAEILKARIMTPAFLRKEIVSTVIFSFPDQMTQLSTPTYKLTMEKQKGKASLVDLASVMVLAPADTEVVDQDKANSVSSDLSLPQPTFCKNCRKWTKNAH